MPWPPVSPGTSSRCCPAPGSSLSPWSSLLCSSRFWGDSSFLKLDGVKNRGSFCPSQWSLSGFKMGRTGAQRSWKNFSACERKTVEKRRQQGTLSPGHPVVVVLQKLPFCRFLLLKCIKSLDFFIAPTNANYLFPLRKINPTRNSWQGLGH